MFFKRLLLMALTFPVLLGFSAPADGATSPETKDQNAKKDESASTAPKVLLKTTEGDITLELDAAKAPATVENFLKYVDEKHYDGTIFHRVIPGFMIQGGGMEENMQEKSTKAPIKNEADNGLKNNVYTIAMARTADPHSATAQFFINVADNNFLNHSAKNMQGWGYAVFGRVIEGKEVVDKVAGVKTTTKFMYEDVPEKTVKIISATRVDN